MSSVRDLVASTYENPPFFSSPKPFCAEGWEISNEISRRRIGSSRQTVGGDLIRATGWPVTQKSVRNCGICRFRTMRHIVLFALGGFGAVGMSIFKVRLERCGLEAIAPLEQGYYSIFFAEAGNAKKRFLWKQPLG